MNLALNLALALLLVHGIVSCLLLLAWLLRHRHVRAAPYSGPRRKRNSKEPCLVASHPRAKADWVREKVIYLASHLLSCRRVKFAFNRWHGVHETVGHTYVSQVMRKHANEIRALHRARKRRKPHFIPVGHTWALDLTFIRSPYGATFTVLVIVDAGSRKLLTLKVLPRKCALLLLGHLLIAFSRHGMPQSLRTDNEAMFHSRLWTQALKALGTRHLFGPIMQPWRNGRVERFIGTLKASLRGVAYRCADSLQSGLDGFAGYYNIARPHMALGGLTPQEVWQGTSMADVQLAHAHGLAQELLVRVLAGFRPQRS